MLVLFEDARVGVRGLGGVGRRRSQTRVSGAQQVRRSPLLQNAPICPLFAREAAWRYRKRKKEEKGQLEERARLLECENAELVVSWHVACAPFISCNVGGGGALQAQLTLLKAELTRVTELLDKHKGCPLLGAPASAGSCHGERRAFQCLRETSRAAVAVISQPAKESAFRRLGLAPLGPAPPFI